MSGFLALVKHRTVAAGLAGLLTTLIIALAVASAALAETAFPPLSGRVVDQADLLDAATEQALTEKLAALEAQSSDQLVVVTVPSLDGLEIEDYGYQLGRAWGIGQKDQDNGALLIVAPTERKVRIEVGYGLEPILTDAFSSQLIRNRILPAFREGDYSGGIVNGVDGLIEQLRLDPAEAEARAAAAQTEEAEAGPAVPLIVIALIGFGLFIVGVSLANGGRRHRRDGVSPILIWAASEALKNAGRGGGGFGGGGFGGFRGGGGGFGGGGASGGW